MESTPRGAWLVRTKLSPPPRPADMLPRPRLRVRLQQALRAHKLTLLSAPAGYGKTTLLAASVEGPAAWLSLDEAENDSALFLAYLGAALQSLEPGLQFTPPPAGLSHPADYARQGVGALVNAVLEFLPDPFSLVLDDLYRLSEPSIYIALDHLLEHLPPHMHLAVATRQDPPLALARLRARGQLAELRLPELRFSRDEAAQFLSAALPGPLSPPELAALYQRTEGWPAGLRLLAASLDPHAAPGERASFIEELGRTQRYLADFLVEEVLNRQGEPLRGFLLQTSILPELSVPLCNAVSGRGDAGQLLAELERRNLLLTALDPERVAWRYHDLLSEALRRQLSQERPELLPELHRRAAEAQDNPVRAVEHYLAARMWPQAAEAIEVASRQLFHQGLLDTLAGWIQALPADVRAEHPRLAWYQGNLALLRGDLATAQALLEDARRHFDAVGDQAGQGEILAQMAAAAFLQADFERAAHLTHRALAYPLPPQALVQLLMGRAWIGFFGGDWRRAQDDLEAAMAVAAGADDPGVLLRLALHLKPDFAVLPDGLTHLERFCRQLAPYVDRPGPGGPLDLVHHELTTFIHLWRGRLDQVLQAGRRALEVRDGLEGFPFIGSDAVAYLAVTHAARGDYAAAEGLFARLLRQIEQVALDQTLKSAALYLMGRARWAAGRPEAARDLYEEMQAIQSERESPTAAPLRAMLGGLLEMAGGRYAAAERSLRRAAALERQVPIAAVIGSARPLLARLYLEWGRPAEALAELEPLLLHCQRERIPGRILQEGAVVVPLLRLAVERGVCAGFAGRLLELLGVDQGPRPLRVPQTGETLTPREVEVLQLVAAGADNRAIAEELTISFHTVKTHVSSILRKLDVSSRTEAAAQFRELGWES